jgi:predicted transcriptional regulator
LAKTHLSHNETKFRILEHLYNETDFVNKNVIRHGMVAVVNAQDDTKLGNYLEDLCGLSLLEKKEKKTAGTQPRWEYKITEEGRNFVNNPKFKNFLFYRAKEEN